MIRHADEEETERLEDWLIAPMVPPEPEDEELPGETIRIGA